MPRVEVTYDRERVSYDDLLEIFWSNYNPTTPNLNGATFLVDGGLTAAYVTPESRYGAGSVSL